MSTPHVPDGELVIEYPMAGETYPAKGEEPQYGVYAYSEYGPGSVLEGQTKRSFVDACDSLAEARERYPTAAWYGHEAGSGYAAQPIPDMPPPGFREDDAGEVWHEDRAY